MIVPILSTAYWNTLGITKDSPINEASPNFSLQHPPVSSLFKKTLTPKPGHESCYYQEGIKKSFIQRWGCTTFPPLETILITLVSFRGFSFGRHLHCLKSVRSQSFSGLHFPVFSPNAGKYKPENLRIRTFFTEW